MRKLFFLFALIILVPLLSYFSAREFNKSKYQGFACKASFSEKAFHDKFGRQIKVKGSLTLDFKHNEIKMYFYDFYNGELKWRGVVLFEPKYNMVGALTMLELLSVKPSVSSLKENDLATAKLLEGGKYPIRIYKLNDSIYFLNISSDRYFCSKEDLF